MTTTSNPITEADWQVWYTKQRRRYTFGGIFPGESLSLDYKTAHIHVSKARGRASSHRCAGHSGRPCSNQAAEWSYDHNDPNPLVTTTGCQYSARIECYSPRCKACHQVIDRSPGDRNKAAT